MKKILSILLCSFVLLTPTVEAAKVSSSRSSSRSSSFKSSSSSGFKSSSSSSSFKPSSSSFKPSSSSSTFKSSTTSKPSSSSYKPKSSTTAPKPSSNTFKSTTTNKTNVNVVNTSKPSTKTFTNTKPTNKTYSNTGSKKNVVDYTKKPTTIVNNNTTVVNNSYRTRNYDNSFYSGYTGRYGISRPIFYYNSGFSFTDYMLLDMMISSGYHNRYRNDKALELEMKAIELELEAMARGGFEMDEDYVRKYISHRLRDENRVVTKSVGTVTVSTTGFVDGLLSIIGFILLIMLAILFLI